MNYACGSLTVYSDDSELDCEIWWNSIPDVLKSILRNWKPLNDLEYSSWQQQQMFFKVFTELDDKLALGVPRSKLSAVKDIDEIV